MENNNMILKEAEEIIESYIMKQLRKEYKFAEKRKNKFAWFGWFKKTKNSYKSMRKI